MLVTGGSGYIAAHCIAQLLQQGFEVRTTVRSANKQEGVRASIAAAGVSDARLSFHIADLTRDDGWDAAMAGCDYVLHVASPLGVEKPGADPDAFVAPARDGTLRVLRAAVNAGVKRVVMTSAAAAARPPQGSKIVSDETVWSDPNDASFDAYRRSKVLAERAAWEFMRSHGGATEFTTVLPAAVFGPVLSRDSWGSVTIVQRMLEGRPGALPRLGFWIVDVRDLAALHILAMSAPQAAGQRYIASGDFMWM
ncbi:MAG: NAD-dependent epimerase/dehydratase family protein, partial [Lysobacter sp.]